MFYSIYSLLKHLKPSEPVLGDLTYLLIIYRCTNNY